MVIKWVGLFVLVFSLNASAVSLDTSKIPEGFLGCTDCFNFVAPSVLDANAIGSPEVGLIVYDSIDDRFKGYDSVGNWQVLAGSGAYALKSRQVFTADGTWTKPEDVVAVLVEVVGAGGGGGGTNNTGTGDVAFGSGGAGGGYCQKLITSELGSSESVAVGSGGSGNVSNDGSSGEASFFGAHCSANGGSGGSISTNSGSTRTKGGGNGGTASGGDLNIIGEKGGSAFFGGVGLSGTGGCSGLFNGAGRGDAFVMGSGSGSGNDASGFGCGGAGAVSGQNQATGGRAGGDGANGVVIVWEYVKN